MSIYCSIHRSEPAHFQCHECDSSLCGTCVSKRESQSYGGKNRDYFCPACELPLDTVGLGNILEPFWNRLSSIFLYPFQLTPLIVTLILSIAGALFPGNIFVQLAVWVIMMKYAYAVLITTAQGKLKAPRITWKLINDDVLQVFKQFGVFLVIGNLGAYIYGVSGIAGSLFLLISSSCLPVIIMVLVVSNSILHALNPFLFIPVIVRIGWPYALMCLFLYFLLGAPVALFYYLPVALFPPILVGFCMYFLPQLYSLISYHLMGYVLLQYHEEIGYSVEYDFFMKHQNGNNKRKNNSENETLKTGLALLVKAGKYSEAIRRAQPYIMEDNPELELSDKFYKLLKLAGEEENAAQYSVKHLRILVNNNKKRQALELFPAVKTGSSRVPDSESVFTIAKWYLECNDPKNALVAYAYFIKNFKTHPLIPEAYFASAKILHDSANNNKKAQQILKGIIATFPKHMLIPQVKKYLQSIATQASI